MSEQTGQLGQEVPVIVIERDDEEMPGLNKRKPAGGAVRQRTWRQWALVVVGTVLLLTTLAAGYRQWAYYYRIGIEVSTTPAQNIQKLKAPLTAAEPEVVSTSDSILGVAMDFYAIHGLQASIQFEEPDTADASVFLYCRCADHKADTTYIGTLVADGTEYQSDRSRLGYMAMTEGHMVIGVGRSDEVKNYVQPLGGSFFRQFVLVSANTIPKRFYLHGKVERRAIGRKGDMLYYIATRYKETLWDFADALREYGFIDAIYITGGTDYSFYRSADGVRHDIGDAGRYPHRKWAGVIPWLVFRRAE